VLHTSSNNSVSPLHNVPLPKEHRISSQVKVGLQLLPASLMWNKRKSLQWQWCTSLGRSLLRLCSHWTWRRNKIYENGLVFWRSRVQISASRQDIITDVINDFPWFLQANSKIYHNWDSKGFWGWFIVLWIAGFLRTRLSETGFVSILSHLSSDWG
jgi:hypothetical protein